MDKTDRTIRQSVFLSVLNASKLQSISDFYNINKSQMLNLMIYEFCKKSKKYQEYIKEIEK